ncbi:hypothetical protein SUGI_0558690 [Cryptomeria japonica]|uniref:uncharacterized protein LOC131075549 n=1 Tax=Cryptomeria japonica TaxID=3369 RepID=UPI002408AAE8|nr:uncharacterized protein LOC131075549 [Cryptomeria japonica]GLJ28388.1 hypothetical protein SUGI_0558690 [Cryptomeria japonica]
MEGGNNGESTSGARKMPRFRSLYRRIKAFSPIPYLVKARDFYMRSISECAGRANYSGLGVSMAAPPKSFSSSTVRNDDEFAELVRAASQTSKSSPGAQGSEIPRSFSTNAAPCVGRIDEESPCYFGGSFRKNVVQSDLRYPRNRSRHPA